MTKKENYINFIVDNMVKDTVIDYDRDNPHWGINYPFENGHKYYLSDLRVMATPDWFRNYLTDKYGVRKEEMSIICELYRKKIDSIVKNKTGWSPLASH